MEHEGHRQRLRERFLKENLTTFEPHEVLEMLLAYAIPRRDTNLLSHRLIDTFGSFNDVLEADVEELVKVEGMGMYAAVLIHMLLPVMRMYEREKAKEKITLRNMQQLKKYCRALFIGITEEKFYAISFNAQMQVLAADLICEGTPNQVGISMRNVISVLLKRNATGVVLVHNHPGGCAMPSQQDVDVTDEIASTLNVMDIRVYDHLVVTDREVSSMKEMGLLLEPASVQMDIAAAAERPMDMKPKTKKKAGASKV